MSYHFRKLFAHSMTSSIHETGPPPQQLLPSSFASQGRTVVAEAVDAAIGATILIVDGVAANLRHAIATVRLAEQKWRARWRSRLIRSKSRRPRRSHHP